MHKIGDKVTIRTTPAEIVCFLRRDNKIMYGVKMLSTLGQEFIIIAAESEIDPPKATMVSQVFMIYSGEDDSYAFKRSFSHFSPDIDNVRIYKLSDGSWNIEVVK